MILINALPKAFDHLVTALLAVVDDKTVTIPYITQVLTDEYERKRTKGKAKSGFATPWAAATIRELLGSDTSQRPATTQLNSSLML